MFNEIRGQIYKMTFVLFLLASLGLWQITFVITAIEANIFLNMTIFGTFGFGAFVAYRNVMGLKNEVHAFDALKEEYEDNCNSELQEASDPYWRYYRCENDAVVFQKPNILEHPFQIISEEIGRTGALAMSTGTMQNLSDSVDARLDEQKSLVSYVTGILVMLGLIGTFVGLMVTLSSVGAIIGNLDLTGGAGAEAIQGLMDGLKVPLQGMATGFSSSLFGLITSLALGLIGRFGNQASSVLKTNFETWLAGVAIVGEATSTKNPGGFGFQERQLDLMFRVARFSLISNSRMMTTVDALTDSTQKMIKTQGNHISSTALLTNSISKMIQSQEVVNRSLIQTGEVLEDRKQLNEVMEELKKETANQHLTYERVNHELESLAERQMFLQESSAETLGTLANRDDLSTLMATVDHKLVHDSSSFRNALESVSNIVRDISTSTQEAQNQAAHQNAQQNEAIKHVEERMANDLSGLRVSIESLARIVGDLDSGLIEGIPKGKNRGMEDGDPLLKAVADTIVERDAAEMKYLLERINELSEGKDITRDENGQPALTVQQMRDLLHEKIGAEETEEQAAARHARNQPLSALGRFFGRGRS